MSDVDNLTEAFSKIGFAEVKVKEIVKNKKVSNALNQVIGTLRSQDPLDNAKLVLLHSLASSTKNSDAASPVVNLSLITDGIVDGRLKSNVQLTAALNYVKTEKENATVEGLNENSGVGIELTKDDVKKVIIEYMTAHKEEIETKRYKHIQTLMNEVRNLPSLKWANPAFFKPIIDEQILVMIGPKDERDVVKKESKKKKAPAGVNAAKQAVATEKRSMFTEGLLGALHKVGENPQAYPELMAEHLKVTKGMVHTRFPPEPN